MNIRFLKVSAPSLAHFSFCGFCVRDSEPMVLHSHKGAATDPAVGGHFPYGGMECYTPSQMLHCPSAIGLVWRQYRNLERNDGCTESTESAPSLAQSPRLGRACNGGFLWVLWFFCGHLHFPAGSLSSPSFIESVITTKSKNHLHPSQSRPTQTKRVVLLACLTK